MASFQFLLLSFVREHYIAETHADGDHHIDPNSVRELIAPIFFRKCSNPICGVFCDGLEDCLGQQGSSQADILRQCQMLKPNCLYPPRYCITCSKRARAAALISPLTLMCLNHLDREMAYCRAQAGAPLYRACFSFKNPHYDHDINSSLFHVDFNYFSGFTILIS